MLPTVTAEEDTPAPAASWAVRSDVNAAENVESEKLEMSSEENVSKLETSWVVNVPGVLVGAGVGAKVGDRVVGEA
eukprot:1098107-Pyramimonas_sp.AAC.1